MITEAAVEENERMKIPDEAVEAAAKAIADTGSAGWLKGEWEDPDITEKLRGEARAWARAALEAGAPYMLSHERQQTADARRDAMVNAGTVDRLDRAVESVFALVRANDRNGVVIVGSDDVYGVISKALQ